MTLKKLFIFDLDGVLVDSKNNHFVSLNEALKEINPKYIISEIDQKNIFEGLPTKEKLKILTQTKGLPENLHENIFNLKQEKSKYFFNNLKNDLELIEIFNLIKSNNIKIAVASNCIKETVETALKSLGVFDLIDFYLSNEDVLFPKPNPEIYIKCMEKFNCLPNEVVIFEDSYIGKMAAVRSKGSLISVKNRSTITKDLIESILDVKQKQINILIPMAGEGSRFSKAGYIDPKPFIDVDGKSMINLVHDNIGIEGKYIYVAKSEHVHKYDLPNHLKQFCNNFVIIEQNGRLDGATKSALLASDLINNDEPLLIANSDQYIEWNGQEVINEFINSGVDGGILTFKSDESKWSYAKINDEIVEEVFEKIVVGDNATCGIYFWRRGSDFVKYANKMIEKNIRTNNEFYICPVYNQAIKDEKIISYYQVNKMEGLGTPEDLENYLFKRDIMVDILTRSYVDSIIKMNQNELCVKYKNPSYKIYDRIADKTDGYIRYNYELDMVELPEAAKNKQNNGPYSWRLHPVITSIHNSDHVQFEDRSVYLAAYNHRFFHIALEILPKLFLLKEKDPNFKLILFGDEEINEYGDFIGLYENSLPKEQDARYLKYWLDELKIDYMCVNLEKLNNFNLNFRSSYVFYEILQDKKYSHITKKYSELFINGPYIYHDGDIFEPFGLLNREDSFLDYETNIYLKKAINNHLKLNYNINNKLNKKIYISRKNYSRVHQEEKNIEDYFVSNGYESVCIENLNPIQQIELIRQSSDVVCYLGSSLVNLYFTNRDTNLIVLSLSSDSDENFNRDMYKYYQSMMNKEYIDSKYINLPETSSYQEILDVLNKEINL